MTSYDKLFFADKDVLIKATKNGIGLAKKELKQLFATICHKSHTIKKVGVTEVLTNIAPQFDEIEKKTRCVIDLPAGVGQSDTSGGATWYEEEDDGNYLNFSLSSADFFEINFFQKTFPDDYQSVKKLGSRSGSTFCRA